MKSVLIATTAIALAIPALAQVSTSSVPIQSRVQSNETAQTPQTAQTPSAPAADFSDASGAQGTDFDPADQSENTAVVTGSDTLIEGTDPGPTSDRPVIATTPAVIVGGSTADAVNPDVTAQPTVQPDAGDVVLGTRPVTGTGPTTPDTVAPDAIIVTPDAGTNVEAAPAAPVATPARQTLASELMEMPVYHMTPRGPRQLGDVTDVVIGADLQVMGYGVRTGGVLGLGGTEGMVPVDRMTRSEIDGRPVFLADFDEAALETFPALK